MEPPKIRVKPGRLAWVDALRGLAALLVALEHFPLFRLMPAGGPVRDSLWHPNIGRTGVICFFLISGFVVPYSFRRDAERPVRDFWIRRIFRIYPAYWISLAIVILLLAFREPAKLNPARMAAHLGLVQAFTGQANFQGNYWTLGVEIAFYVLCAALFAAKWLHRPGVLVAGCWVFTGLFAFPQWMGWARFMTRETALLPYALAVMLTGTLIRQAFEDKRGGPGARNALAGAAASFGLPLAAVAAGRMGHGIGATPMITGVSHLLGLALFFAAMAWLKRPPRVLTLLGTVSYSFYLFHPVFITAVVHLAEARGVPWDNAWGSSLTLALTLGASLIVYRLVEKPAIEWGRRLAR
jgi:peptidoglycan/LPS O-acetylase OafA/YrhL